MDETILSAHLHILLTSERCPDYEGMAYCRKRPAIVRKNVILELTESRLVRFRLGHIGAYRLRELCPEHLVHRSQILEQGAQVHPH